MKEDSKFEKTELMKNKIFEEIVRPKIESYDKIIDHLAETVYAMKLELTKSQLAEGEKYVKSTDARITQLKQ